MWQSLQATVAEYLTNASGGSPVPPAGSAGQSNASGV